MRPDRLFQYTVREIPRLSPQNQRALAYALGWRYWKDSYEASFLYKMNHRYEFEFSFPQELLPLYYRGVGALMTDGYDPSAGKWFLSFMEALHKIDPGWQKMIFWGAGFEAPLLYEDPFEYERMLKGIPTPYQPFFKQGLQDRLEWGGRNYWIEGKRKDRKE